MSKYILLIILSFLFVSCKNVKKEDSSTKEENTEAKALLQGIWLDDETEAPLMRIVKDTIYYADSQSTPVYFEILADTLYTYGNELTRYRIDHQTEISFWFHSLSDHTVKLHKSEDPNDSLAFAPQAVEAISTYIEVIKKDSVVMYDNQRYRTYLYINPSKMKVVRTTYSEDGMSMDNVYYDNVMHICIYEGKRCLYASDITKQMFEKVVSSDFLRQAILSDIDFTKVDRNGFHFQMTICVPESSVCNLFNLIIAFDGQLSIS